MNEFFEIHDSVEFDLLSLVLSNILNDAIRIVPWQVHIIVLVFYEGVCTLPIASTHLNFSDSNTISHITDHACVHIVDEVLWLSDSSSKHTVVNAFIGVLLVDTLQLWMEEVFQHLQVIVL